MLRVWNEDRCLQLDSIHVYLLWIKRFRDYCIRCGFDEQAELTLAGTRRFIAWYARRRHLGTSHFKSARSALHALSHVYQVMGHTQPVWQRQADSKSPTSRLLREYADHLTRHRGNPKVTVDKRLAQIERLLAHLRRHRKTWRTMSLHDIDEFLVEFSHRNARSTTADIAGGVRSFARFLLATQRIPFDLAESVISPVQPRYAHPPKALPWKDVQRLLKAVDLSSAQGLRDYALLLMMSTYGLGAGEVIGLKLQDIDWNAGTFNVVRAKTGVAYTLPLLSSVAKALAQYLQHGRPKHAQTRHVFVQMRMPFNALGSASPIRHILRKHAAVAGLDAPYLGSHVLRYSNATRQMDLGIRPQVLSDLLGHRDPESISAYVRIATESLREVSLPVPT